MQDDLHEQIWLSYRRTMLADWSGNPTEAFGAALDVYLGTYRHAAPAAACSAVAYMIAMRPRGVGRRARGAAIRPPAIRACGHLRQAEAKSGFFENRRAANLHM